MKNKKQKSEWTGDKARPTNRAKTWGYKERDPKQDRRDWNRHRESGFLLSDKTH
jgi:hypothetical protein|tara:strand:+ start:1634 stop:1795 length:162 start_codon:yes stop_codon:yes gene_type:complete